jgi:hypothetical protein
MIDSHKGFVNHYITYLSKGFKYNQILQIDIKVQSRNFNIDFQFWQL